MSGIFGMWKLGNGKIEWKTEVEQLYLWNRAYGEEGEEQYMDENICIGAFLEKFSGDVGNASEAPVIKENRKYAVIDALIYNREELCNKLKIEEICSDEQLLFRYIEKYGPENLKEVNGDFCGAIYDTEKKALTLFRDHMGVRPLFYYADEACVAFSTDIRGLIGTELVNKKIDEKWLWGQMVGAAFMGTENTEFAHVFCVKPASYMSFSLGENGICKEKQTIYWKLGGKKIRLKSEAAYIEKMRELITDAVKRRLDAVSGMVGAELSGGLDSGVIDILIHRLGRDCTYFSWSASPEEIPFAEGDERIVIEDICKQEGINCNYAGCSLIFDEKSILTEKTKQIGIDVALNEGPYRMYVFPPYIGTLQIAEAAQFMKRNGVRVIFSGHGGDEGVSHRCSPYELFYHKEYVEYFKHVWPSTKGTSFRIARTLKRCYTNVKRERAYFAGAYEDVHMARGIMKKEFYDKYAKVKRPPLRFAYDAKAYINDGGSRNRLDVVALLGGYTGVRYLMPYLDYRVVDFAVSIPRHMYLKNQVNRYIFREAFKEMMPDSLYTRDDKSSSSWSNLEKKEQEEAEYLQQKKWYAGLLNREYWSDYFDWKELDRWSMQERREEDLMKDKGIFRNISLCVLMQNLIEKSQRVTDNSKK